MDMVVVFVETCPPSCVAINTVGLSSWLSVPAYHNTLFVHLQNDNNLCTILCCCLCKFWVSVQTALTMCVCIIQGKPVGIH